MPCPRTQDRPAECDSTPLLDHAKHRPAPEICAQSQTALVAPFEGACYRLGGCHASVMREGHVSHIPPLDGPGCLHEPSERGKVDLSINVTAHFLAMWQWVISST